MKKAQCGIHGPSTDWGRTAGSVPWGNATRDPLGALDAPGASLGSPNAPKASLGAFGDPEQDRGSLLEGPRVPQGGPHGPKRTSGDGLREDLCDDVVRRQDPRPLVL